MERSIADGATVPLYYESRLIKLSRDTQINLDEEMEELTEEEDTSEAQKNALNGLLLKLLLECNHV